MKELINVTKEYELEMIQNLLKENNIPFVTKDTAMGGYMRIYSGTSFYGTTICVKEKDFNKAEELINQILEPETNNIKDDN